MDFSLVLVILTGVSGVVWGIEVLYRRVVKSEASSPPSDNLIVEYSRSFFPVLLLVLVVRSFLFEPFRIPSSSMVPTLLVGDFIFVNKFIYGLRLPVAHKKILDIGEPERGDVMVFRLPSDPSVNYIKRLVGLPGDTIDYQNKRLFIDGQLVALERKGEVARAAGPRAILARETLGDATHDIVLEPFSLGREGRYIVPDGHYFMMGDNRDNSQDSRFPQVGFVPQANIVGKAVRIWMNWDFPGAPQWGRIGTKIQ
jgi:signal peptidase I